MAKLLGARVAWAAADNALQIHGGNGFALEYQISRVLCDARILNIFEGAAEIQAQVIAVEAHDARPALAHEPVARTAYPAHQELAEAICDRTQIGLVHGADASRVRPRRHDRVEARRKPVQPLAPADAIERR
jgi:hypothetical protein